MDEPQITNILGNETNGTAKNANEYLLHFWFKRLVRESKGYLKI